VHTLFTPRHVELDITDASALKAWCESIQPDLVINCSVVDVDRSEREPQLAAAVNVTGPQTLAAAARECQAAVMHFSTNYVFAGRTHGRIYSQSDETEPINVYGQTKLAGERAVLAANERSYIVRTSWVFGAGKESFLATVPRRLRAGERIRAIHDVWASATYVCDLVDRVLAVLAREHYGTYQLVNAGVLSYADFAAEAARLCGADLSLIERVSENEAQRLAERPRYTPMRCALSDELGLAPLRDWRKALADYIQQH
jgi:dTDP-4-dehydrorhamnose reductase